MQGSPYYGSPYQPPSPSLSSSGGSRRVQNAANVYGLGTSSTSGPVLRPSPRKLQSYYITPGNGQSAGGRLPPFSPQLSPQLAARHDDCSSVTDKGEEASSPPPEETSAHFQPEAITTAAAYNSPSLFSSKVAQKRFNAGTLYAEADHPVYEDDIDRTPGIAGRPFISPYKPSGLSQTSSTPYSNGYPYAVSSRAAYGQESHSRQSLTQRLRILPLHVQRFFRTRRKKSLSPGLHTAPSRGTRQTSRPRRLFLLCLILAVGIYLFWPRRVSTSGTSTPPPDLEVTNNATAVSTASLPARKWWQSPPATSVIAKPPRVRKKATSHASLSHNLTELMALPSRYKLLSDEHWPPTELPTLTIIIDCIGTRDPLASEHKEAINHLLAALANDKYPPSAIRLLISPDDYPRTNPGLYGYERGKTSIYTLSPSSENVLSTPAFGNIETEFLLLLQCPTSHAPAADEAENPTFLASLLQIAGNEQYANKALTMSGLARKPLSVGDNGYVAYGMGKGTLEDGYDEVKYRQLSESRVVDIPYGSLLIQSTWLKSLEIAPENNKVTSDDSHTKSLGLIGKIGRGLHENLDVKTWALPLVLPAVYRTSAYITDFLDFARHLPEDASIAMQDVIPHEAALGSPAKLAVLLSKTDLEFAASWETIICGFADEAVFGHEVRAFVSDEMEDSQVFVLSCPEVEVSRMTIDALQAWSPNVCLTSSEGYVDIKASDLSCFNLRLPSAELAYIDWIPALPLESILKWNVPKVDLAVITNNRPISLHRLLTSLRSAHYLGDNVNLFLNLEQTTDDQTKKVIEGSQWPFGQVSIRHRVVLGGLMTSIVESWYPLNDDTYGVLLEDDVEGSPLFYSWLKFTILYYRYGTKAMRRKTERLYGISLYQPKNIELRPEGRRKFDAHKLLDDLGLPSTLPYLSQIPCSWGAVYFPEHWREFHQFLSIRLSEATLDLADPIVPNIRSNRWPNSWKRYLIELVYLRGYSMLYPNNKDFKSLSTNHLEQGTHVKDESQAQKRRDLFEVPLLSEGDSLMDELPDGILPSWSSLPIIDFWGSLVNEQEIIERGRITSEELELCLAQRFGDIDSSGIDDGFEQTFISLDHDAARLLCNGPMDEQDWKEWRMRIQHGANEIDVRMLMEREARLEERERRVEEMERRGEAA